MVSKSGLQGGHSITNKWASMRGSLTPVLVWGDLVNCQGQQNVQIPQFHLSSVVVILWRELVENRKGPVKSTCIYRSLEISQTPVVVGCRLGKTRDGVDGAGVWHRRGAECVRVWDTSSVSSPGRQKVAVWESCGSATVPVCVLFGYFWSHYLFGLHFGF